MGPRRAEPVNTSVFLNTEVVKRSVEHAGSPVVVSKAEELLARIDWVLENKADVVKNANQWSQLARYSDGAKLARTQVTAIRSRIRKWIDGGKVDSEPTQEVATLEALADAAQVSRIWFVSGAGKPDQVGLVQNDERYAAMPAVRAMGRAEGYDEDFVTTWQAELDADDQPSADELWGLMKSSWARLQRKTRAQGDPLADLDDRPLRTARKKR